jgi:hypothetical protein
MVRAAARSAGQWGGEGWCPTFPWLNKVGPQVHLWLLGRWNGRSMRGLVGIGILWGHGGGVRDPVVGRRPVKSWLSTVLASVALCNIKNRVIDDTWRDAA